MGPQTHAGRIDGIHAFPHPHGCSQLGDDLAGTRDLLAGLAANPNAAGVLLLGLGCESNQLDALREAIAAHYNVMRVLVTRALGLSARASFAYRNDPAHAWFRALVAKSLPR